MLHSRSVFEKKGCAPILRLHRSSWKSERLNRGDHHAEIRGMMPTTVWGIPSRMCVAARERGKRHGLVCPDKGARTVFPDELLERFL